MAAAPFNSQHNPYTLLQQNGSAASRGRGRAGTRFSYPYVQAMPQYQVIGAPHRNSQNTIPAQNSFYMHQGQPMFIPQLQQHQYYAELGQYYPNSASGMAGAMAGAMVQTAQHQYPYQAAYSMVPAQSSQQAMYQHSLPKSTQLSKQQQQQQQQQQQIKREKRPLIVIDPITGVNIAWPKAILDVLKDNSVPVQVVKCILLGPPEVGKTQLKRALLGNFEEVLESTNCSTQATPAVEVYIDGGKEWKTFSEQHLKSFTSMDNFEKSYLPTSTNSSATKEDSISNPSLPPVDTNEAAPSQSTNPSDSSRIRAEFHRLSRDEARQIEEAKSECSDSLKFKLMYIIDNGGQPSFLDFHSVTATFPASYFLVYDARKGLDACPEMTFRKSDFRIKEMPPSNYSNCDLLRRSLLTVHHFTHRFTKRSKLIENLLPGFKPPSAPSTLIIGTHIDTTDQKCENPDSDDKRLKRLYQNIPSLQHQVSVYCVDSMKPECKALTDIRNTISRENNLSDFPFPLSWFQLYLLSLSVGSMESLQVHKYSDLYDMCLQENHVKSKEEFRQMVTIMDCLGVFSCPDVEVLTSSTPDADVSNILVFIDPNLLFKYISRILIIPYWELPPICLSKLQVCGELTKECIAQLNIPDTLGTLPGFHEKLLEWLVKWGLAAKMDGIDRWFIPSVLPPRPKTVSASKSNEYFCEVFPFYLTFTQATGNNYTFHYLPGGFFPLFVVFLIQSKYFSLSENNPYPEAIILPEDMQASSLPPRCRDSLLLLKESDHDTTFNVRLVDEANRLAVHMSPANQDLYSDTSTLKHAGAILAVLRDCMIGTNNKLFSANTDRITLCSACRCDLRNQGHDHLAQIKKKQKDKPWISRCLHEGRLELLSGCYEKSIIDTDMAQVLKGFACDQGVPEDSIHLLEEGTSVRSGLGSSLQSSNRRSSSSTCHSRSFSDQSQSSTHESNLSSSKYHNQTEGSRQETTFGSGMSLATGEMNVKTIIQPLRSYLNDTLPIDTDLLTALQDQQLIPHDYIQPWKGLLSQGRENDARCALVDYLEKYYTYEYLTKFTDLLMEHSKKPKPILEKIAKKLRVQMEKGL